MSIITLEQRQKRDNAADVITEVRITRVEKLCYPEYNIIAGMEHSRFCYVDGYRENGRDIGARNPYDMAGNYVRIESYSSKKGTTNAYIVGSDPGDWHEIPTASSSDV